MRIEEFIDNIKSDYLYFLYENYNDIFPGCCHEASNLLCGYLNHYFKNDAFKHKCISDVPRPHSYISNEKGIIIDFTSWQYISNYYGKLINETPHTLIQKAEQNKGFPLVADGIIYFSKPIKESDLIKLHNIVNVDFYCTNEIEKFSPNLFMDYCNKERAKKVKESLYQNGIY